MSGYKKNKKKPLTQHIMLRSGSKLGYDKCMFPDKNIMNYP